MSHIIHIEQLNKSHYDQLKEILLNETHEMHTSHWTEDRFEKLFQYIDEDNKIPPQQKEYFYWAVIVDGNCVGKVACHPVHYDTRHKFKDEFFISIVLSPHIHNKGVGTSSVKQMLNKFHKLRPDIHNIYADIHCDNEISMKLFHKLDFKKMNGIKVNIGHTRCIRFVKHIE